MTTFFKPLHNELQTLANDGVLMAISRGQEKLHHVNAPIMSVDSGAKTKLQRHKAHNGRCGCGFCTHPNLPVPGFPGNQYRFVIKDKGVLVPCEDRTHCGLTMDMLKADELDRKGLLKRSTDGSTYDHLNGVLGISCMAGIPKFDVAFGYVIDYLHTILLGNFAAVLKLLFDDKEAASEIPNIDKRLKVIKPPHNMDTPTRLLSEKSDWKGTSFVWTSFLFALFTRSAENTTCKIQASP